MKMTPEQMTRLLRAKEHELEAMVRDTPRIGEIDFLRADIALIAGILADYIEMERR